MIEDILIVERHAAGYAVLTLNRPHAMNALSLDLANQIVDTVRDLEADPATKVVVITGAGRAFCAGLDMREWSNSNETFLSSMIGQANPVAALESFRGPVIGAINGSAVTGGFELALACDILIAGESARFADSHARVGLLPGWGLSQKLSRMVGLSRAKEISLLGDFVSAERASQIGLVNHVVPDAELLPYVRRIAEELAALPSEMLNECKRLIDDGYAVSLAEGRALEKIRSATWNSKVTSADIEQRRAGVQQRGKAQLASSTPSPVSTPR
jgi:enoyl-CoA hydratase